jgi:hypothetical protein
MGGPGERRSTARDVRRQGHRRRGRRHGKGIRARRATLRAAESGYVRNYALGIGVGAVLLLGWFVARASCHDGFPILTAIIVLPAARRARASR